jgi:hypothetical protein
MLDVLGFIPLGVLATPTCVWLGEVKVASSTLDPRKSFASPKIQYLEAALFRDHDIGRLQVTMHDVFFVSSGKCIGQRSGDFDDLLDWEAALANQAVQRQPFDQLHRQEERHGSVTKVSGFIVDIGRLRFGSRMDEEHLVRSRITTSDFRSDQSASSLLCSLGVF